MNKHEAEKEFARAAALAEQGQYADADQVRASAEIDYERANGRPYSPLDDTPAEINGSYVTPDGKAQIDFGITYSAFGAKFHAQGYYNRAIGQQVMEEIAKAYPDDKEVQLWYRRWKLHHLKDATMIRGLVEAEARKHPARSFYDHQAQQFLTTNGLRLRATLADSKPAPWSDGGKSGHHYKVYIWREGRVRYVPTSKPAKVIPAPRKITFDFWDSIANAEKDARPTAYDVLACIASDAHCPDSFNEWCSEYGEDPDSLKARQTFNRCASFARRLRAFFTPSELEQLSAIQ